MTPPGSSTPGLPLDEPSVLSLNHSFSGGIDPMALGILVFGFLSLGPRWKNSTALHTQSFLRLIRYFVGLKIL